MSESGRQIPEVKRFRALATALIFFALIVLGFFFIPQWIVTESSSLSREFRVWLATGWIGGSFVALAAWAWRATAPSKNAGPNG